LNKHQGPVLAVSGYTQSPNATFRFSAQSSYSPSMNFNNLKEQKRTLNQMS
jgi:hypothetical protein